MQIVRTFVAATVVAAFAVPAAAQQVTFMTGPQGGSWIPLGGAGLDVFEEEPKMPEALWGMENVVLTPHIGSGTHETRAAMSGLTLDNLVAHFAGKPVLTPVP